MGQTCTNCSRVNPHDAAYCYYDGAVLAGHSRDGGPLAVGSQPFVNPFVFPSGQQCRTFDELALACQNDWPSARDLLQQGFFESFLDGVGRADLAQAAREAARFPDHDRGLDQLLGKLPTNVVEAPRLFVAPQEVSLGTLKVGEERGCEMHLENRGMRLLYGSVTVDDCDWLALGDSPGAPEKIFQFGAEMLIPVQVKGKRLRAGNKPLEGRLTIESNGGTTTVLVRAEVPVRPFPAGVLKGAVTPRQVAEKAKAAPKEAAPAFEKGAVADWYKSNGWIYPVQGPSASGLGAVQQFFEALGLTPAPKVDISERAVRLEATAGAMIRHVLQIKSKEKRPVYAHAISNAAWLEIGRPKLNGRVASIPIVVPNVPDRAGETLSARVTVQANGNQRFVVPVTLVIGGSFNFGTMADSPPPIETAKEPVAKMTSGVKAAPKATSMPVIAVDRARRRKGFSVAHLLPVAALLLVLLGVMAADWFMDGKPAVGPYTNLKDPEPRLGIDFDDRKRFGIVLLTERDPEDQDKFKKLTYDAKGTQNNTCIKVDGHEYLFGNDGYGKWVKKDIKRGNDRHGWDNIWLARNENIQVTQSVDLVPGDQTQLLDTVLVRYTVENRSEDPHKVGLRLMLDTFIGANDGVPFAVPGSEGKPDRLVDTMEEFDQEDIPDYVQALERPDLKNPGTVAHLGLKLTGDFDPLVKMIICRWPDNRETKWTIDPVESMRANPDNPDSCVVLYWAYETMEGGTTRKMAFTYGLSSISGVAGMGAAGDGKIALTTGGSTRPNHEFTVTAYVRDPQPGQVVKLILPYGFSFAQGNEAEKKIEATSGGLAQVSWRVRSGKEGNHVLQATSGTAQATLSIRIHDEGIY